MTAIVERTWTNIDKAAWGDGPWQSEPDKVQWVDEATGLDCLVVRHESSGHWCGYVGVPPEHACHGVGYDDVRVGDDYPDVHGGLTFSDRCMEDAVEGKGVCHVPYPGRPDDVWWLGFDCAHYRDLSPGYAARSRELGLTTEWETTYKHLGFVRSEVALLAKQLVAATRTEAP